MLYPLKKFSYPPSSSPVSSLCNHIQLTISIRLSSLDSSCVRSYSIYSVHDLSHVEHCLASLSMFAADDRIVHILHVV